MQGYYVLYFCVRVFTLLSGGNADVVKPDGTDSSIAHELWMSGRTQGFNLHIQFVQMFHWRGVDLICVVNYTYNF